MKKLFIAEKPSVAREFAKTLGVKGGVKEGYIEDDSYVITWCYGHLVTMSYPDKYDEKYKKWSLETLPFMPEEYLYEIIPSAKKQFKTVSALLSREDVDTIYVCTDSGREGEYIYRLVEQMSPGKVKEKTRKRVWIDSQTEEEILKGIENAKDLSEYDDLADSAYLRAKEDYLMGINFSRLLTIKYGGFINRFLDSKWTAVSVGRVMTCVLGMVVRREIEIRNFKKTPFYRINAVFSDGGNRIESFWKLTEKSSMNGHPDLYRDCGFTKKETASEFIESLKKTDPYLGIINAVTKKKEKVNPPLLYNLAELQNDCSKRLHISPDETLKIVQDLYEKKLLTYPRTDARVLSTAVAKEITKNLEGLRKYEPFSEIAGKILDDGMYSGIEKTRYTNDKAITDHYAIIPTGSGLSSLRSLKGNGITVYKMVASRFLSIFYPAAVYKKASLEIMIGNESFFSNFKALEDPGFLFVAETILGSGRDSEKSQSTDKNTGERSDSETDDEESGFDISVLNSLKKGMALAVDSISIKEGSTTPPKRYTSGSMILAMENAGQLIEDPALRELIKGSGIGTSATRAEILNKLIKNKYIKLNKKTQVLTPEYLGEMIVYTVNLSIRALLMPNLTASWEKGLTYVADGKISKEEYMEKMERFIEKNVNEVKALNNTKQLASYFTYCSQFYSKGKKSGKGVSK